MTVGFIAFIEEHAAEATQDVYGAEIAAGLDGGGCLRTSAMREHAEYVRVCDRRGRELTYWHANEFAEDFPVVMGAVLALCCDVIRDNGRNVLAAPDDASEVLIPAAAGRTVRCKAYPAAVMYVRVCDGTGKELGRWDEAALARDFSAAISDFIKTAGGRDEY